MGFVYFNGAGLVTIIYTPQYSRQHVRVQIGLASDTAIPGTFTRPDHPSLSPFDWRSADAPPAASPPPSLSHRAAGWGTFVNNSRWSIQYINAFIGSGSQVWIGAGGAVFLRNYLFNQRNISFSTTNFTYTVAGTGVRNKNASKDIVVTSEGIRFLPTPSPTRAIADADPNNNVRKLAGIPSHRRRRLSEYSRGQSARERLSMSSENGVRARDARMLTSSTPPPWYPFPPPAGSDLVSDAKTLLHDAAAILPSSLVVVGDTIIEETASFPSLPNITNTAFGNLPNLLTSPIATDTVVTGSKPTIVASTGGNECFLCSVGPGSTQNHVAVEGGACTSTDECTADSPLEAYQLATQQHAFPKDIPGTQWLPKNFTLPDISLAWYQVVVYCESLDPNVASDTITSGCSNATVLKSVLLDYLLLNNKTYNVAVASAALHSAVTSIVDKAFNDSLAPAITNPNCQGWSTYNVYLTYTAANATCCRCTVFPTTNANPAAGSARNSALSAPSFPRLRS